MRLAPALALAAAALDRFQSSPATELDAVPPAPVAGLREYGPEGRQVEDPGSKVLVVTGLWDLPSRHSAYERSGLGFYDAWMAHSTHLNADYHVFGSEEGLAHVRARRDDWAQSVGATTTYDLLACSDFRSYKLVSEANLYVECHDRVVWAEKVELVRKAAAKTPPAEDGGYDWFAWVDIGINRFREKDPPATRWPSPGSLSNLPHDRVVANMVGISSSTCHLEPSTTCMYTDLCVAGTGWLIHRRFINTFSKMYYSEVSKCIAKRRRISDTAWKGCLDDQGIHTALIAKNAFYFPGVEDQDSYVALDKGVDEGWAVWVERFYREGSHPGLDAAMFYNRHKRYSDGFKRLVENPCD